MPPVRLLRSAYAGIVSPPLSATECYPKNRNYHWFHSYLPLSHFSDTIHTPTGRYFYSVVKVQWAKSSKLGIVVPSLVRRTTLFPPYKTPTYYRISRFPDFLIRSPCSLLILYYSFKGLSSPFSKKLEKSFDCKAVQCYRCFALHVYYNIDVFTCQAFFSRFLKIVKIQAVKRWFVALPSFDCKNMIP